MLRLPQFLHFTSLLLRREPCTACFNFSGGMFTHGRRQVTMLVGAMSKIKSDIFFIIMPAIPRDQGKTESRLCDRVTDTFPGRLGADVL